jgi:hypothetical protein
MIHLACPTRLVVDGFDRVAVRIENERTVVAGAVLASWAGLAVAPVAGAGHAVPPRLDSASVGNAEADVQVSRQRMLLIQGLDAEVAPLDPLAFDGGRAERLLVEGAACSKIGDGDVDVVEHAHMITHAPRAGRPVAQRRKIGPFDQRQRPRGDAASFGACFPH